MLVGYVDPSHDERKRDVAGRKPNWFTTEDLLDNLLTRGPKWSPWSYELANAVIKHHQERDYLSTSLLTGGCPRGNIIERKEDYVDSLDARYLALRGTLIHRTMELAVRDTGIAEWRFWADMNGLEFSCSPDFIEPDRGQLIDYKTTENPPQYQYPYRHHTEQVQLNRWVVNNAVRWQAPEHEPLGAELAVHPRDIRFRELGVVYLGPKGPKPLMLEKRVDQRGPNGMRKVSRMDAAVWSDEEVLAFLDPRLEAVEMALANYPAWPEGLEDYPGWEGPPSWECPGPPTCRLDCLAKRWPDGLVW